MLMTHPDDIIELCLTDTKIARICNSTYFKKEYKKRWNTQEYVLLIMEMPEIAESKLAQMLVCKPHEADKFEAFIDRHPEFTITWTARQRTIYEYSMEDLDIERKIISLPIESYKILKYYTSTVNNDITAGILNNIEGGTDEEEIDRLTQEWFDIWDKGERLYFDKIYI